MKSLVLLFLALITLAKAKGLLEQMQEEARIMNQLVCQQLQAFYFYNSNPGSDISLVCRVYGLNTVSVPTDDGNSAVFSAINTFISSCGLKTVWISSVNVFQCVYMVYPLASLLTTNCDINFPIVCSRSGPQATTTYTATETFFSFYQTTSTITQLTTTLTTTTTTSTLISTSTIPVTSQVTVTFTSSEEDQVTRDTTSTVPVYETVTLSSTQTFTFTETVYASTLSIYTITRTKSTSSTVTSTASFLTTLTSTLTSSSCPITLTSVSTEQSTVRVTVVNIVPVFTTVTFTAETRINCC